jgi:hypothetical protein
MTKWMKAACMLLALASTLFCFVGYAALSDTLQITGQVQVDRPDKIFIAKIENIKTSNGATCNVAPQAVDFPSAKFISKIDFPGKVTFDVTLVNGTSVKQIYDRLEAKTGAYDATGVTVKVQYKDANGDWKDLKQRYEFPAGATLECKVTMTCGQNVTKNMMHEFIFVTDPEHLTQHVSQPLLAKYDALINNTDLYGIFADYGKDHKNLWLYGGANQTGAYISNSSGYDPDQVQAVNDALDDITKITINGEEKNVTVLLKQQDVCDWVDGEERLIYFTADPLNDQNNKNAPVFVCVFYLDAASGKWLPIGGMKDGEYMIFEGTANVCNRSGQTGTGNFDTNNWHPSQDYFGVDHTKQVNVDGKRQLPTLKYLMTEYHKKNP